MIKRAPSGNLLAETHVGVDTKRAKTVIGENMEASLVEEHVLAYISVHNIYTAYVKSLKALLENLLRTKDIEVVTVEGRAKTIESFREKITREGKDYTNPLSQVTDLAGIRIVTYQLKDIDLVSELISENFSVDVDNSVDKRRVLEADRFGYLSVHYVVGVDERRIFLPEYESFKTLKAEIQVRTVLQHAWAAIDHKLRYKTKKEIPIHLRRKLYRVSALLETADSEFEVLRTNLSAIRLKYEEDVKKQNLDLSLDLESLNAYATGAHIIEEIEQLAIGNGYVIGPYNPDAKRPQFSSLLKALNKVNISSVADFDVSLKKMMPKVSDLLQKVNNHWKEAVGEKALKLVVGRDALLRIVFPLALSDDEAIKSISESEFGNKLKTAVEQAYQEICKQV